VANGGIERKVDRGAAEGKKKGAAIKGKVAPGQYKEEDEGQGQN